MHSLRSASSGRQRANAELAERALRCGAGRAVHRPVEVYLQVASACNLDCYMCSEHNRPLEQRRGRGLESMSPEIFARVEAEILPWSSRVCLGVGGEPTLSDHFVEYVRRCARAGQEIHLTTNGTRFDHGDVAEVVAHDVSFVQLSLDAASAETYERIRRGSRWKRMLHGLERLADLRDAAPAGQRCHLTLCFVLMRSNVHELPAFVELARQVRADAVRAQHVIPVTREGVRESLIGAPERYDRLRAEAVDRARSLGIPLEVPRAYALDGDRADPELAPAPPRESPDPTPSCAGQGPLAGHAVPCRLPNQSLYVLFDGRVFPCCHPFAHQKMQVGDLRAETFGEIWNQRLLRNLRVGLRSGDVPAICRDCSIVHSPPPAAESLAGLRDSPGLEEHYGARDLEPDHEPAGWMEYVADLRQHADNLEAERPHHLGHIANLERERARLEREIGGLRRHATDLERERAALAGHGANREAERPHLLGHIANLERERDALRRHAADLEAERPHLRGHIGNLERERGWRGVVRQIARALKAPRLRRSPGPGASAQAHATPKRREP